jgi:hypothetical protein
MKHSLAIQMMNKKAFDDYRDVIQEEFISKGAIHKKRLTQGVYWVSSEKDLANQYVREEKWFFGIKMKDDLKLVDHNIRDDLETVKKVGFTN